MRHHRADPALFAYKHVPWEGKGTLIGRLWSYSQSDLDGSAPIARGPSVLGVHVVFTLAVEAVLAAGTFDWYTCNTGT